MKYALFLIIVLILFSPQKSEAVDPVTIAVLTPVAIEGAKIAAPYVIRGLASGGKHVVQMASHTAEILLIPWGVGQLLLFDPASGTGNIFQGVCAPFKLIGDVFILPFAFCGIDFGS